MADFNESPEKEIDYLFEEARQELAKVDENAKELKKDIVNKLAKKLEEKIRIDAICIEIVTQLHDEVSERFIRECLPEKYKQKHKVENAKKQKRKQREEYNNLAAETPLDNKEVIIVDTDSRTSFFQEEEDEQSSKTATDELLNDKTFTQSSSNPQHLEQEQKIHWNDGQVDSDPEGHDVYGTNDNVKGISEQPLDEPRQLISTEDKIVQGTELGSTSNISANILPFEISWIFRDIRSYLAPLHSKIGDNGRVWVSGLIDKNTGVVISQYFGRLNHQQRQHQQNDGNSTDSINVGGIDEA